MSLLRNIGLTLIGICLGGVLKVPYIGKFYFAFGAIGVIILVICQHSNPGETKRYRCVGCGNIFYVDDPPSTIPTSVVWCPSCGEFAERDEDSTEIWSKIWAKKPLTDKFDATFLKDEPAYWKKEMDKWLENDVIPFIEELEGKAEKLDAIEVLMRGQSFIQININDQYSIQPRLSHKGTEIVSAIMAILFPDDPDEPESS